MNTYQKVICDECKKEFKLSDKNVKKHWLDKEKQIEETYFDCPKCKHRYTISVTDAEVRQAIETATTIELTVKPLIEHKETIIKKAKKKSLELEKQWKQQS
ncbi:hypothetical protein ACQR2L_13735 [Clostridium butyricum]|jgi:DNA-directed RNA polymerase subunit RPC12/RpoP|uniref:hypothetical protein n=1 Tax=Clostridium butyricum TaxID=1492 RepID=UPI0021046BE4|nr:hypothetical protein [Clostridium butyricum]MCQ2014658.1 hypothetical protein [Clostridium butyricum]MCQ2026575.1 hypothetical protein [Clostridium butyricum]MDU6040573.1 hypothetical protein [Clostridium butyricum]